ncbi:MAG: hypothetical protein ABII90_01295 [Bacteroidota bacterium]
MKKTISEKELDKSFVDFIGSIKKEEIAMAIAFLTVSAIVSVFIVVAGLYS